MRTPRDSGWLLQAQKARAKRQTRSIGNVTAANLARTCVAGATASSDRWRSSRMFHGVRRALILWAASGALVATSVLGWLRRHTCCVIAFLCAQAASPFTGSYPMAHGASCT